MVMLHVEIRNVPAEAHYAVFSVEVFVLRAL